MFVNRAFWVPVFAIAASACLAQEQVEPVILESYPDEIQARIEIRDRHLAQLVPLGPDGHGADFVLQRMKLWSPAQTIRVAFRDGSYQLRRDVMNMALQWTEYANLTLDFGHDEQAQTFYEWSANDQDYQGDIRISFTHRGYWSLVGTDSNNPAIVSPGEASLNLGGFHIQRPPGWDGTVLHEFGHALGFQHEHQHPIGGCDTEFRWNDDPGYIPTRDQLGQFIADRNGRRPGIYTVLGGPPNEWPRWKVDHNLRQLQTTDAFRDFALSQFDPNSIMKYYFPAWMFHGGTQSHCFTVARNNQLSRLDGEGAATVYPHEDEQLAVFNAVQREAYGMLRAIPELEGGEQRPLMHWLETQRPE